MRRTFRSRTAWSVLVCLLLFGALSGVTAQADRAEKEGGELVIARSDPPTSLDPHKTGEDAANQVMSLLGGSLVALDPETLEVRPSLAERFEVSEDGLTFTFYLKEGVSFHNGEPLTAEDWKYTFERALDPGTQTVVAGDLLGNVESVEVVDDYTLRIVLSEPSAVFLRNLALAGYLQPLNQGAVETLGEDFARQPVGVGPYTFDEWLTGFSITLQRNEDFAWPNPWFENTGSPYIQEIEFRYIPEQGTLIAALETGEVDVATVPPSDVFIFEDNPQFDVVANLQSGLGLMFLFNMNAEKFSDVRVRQAIGHAIDKQFFIDRRLEGRGQAAYSALPPTLPGYWEEAESAGYAYDLERARALLDEAGWTEGADGVRTKDGERLTINMITRSSDDQIQAAELFQNQMQQIGVEVDIQSFERALHTELLQSGDYDMSPLGYIYNDPDILYFLFHSSQHPAGLNFSAVNNPELDALLEAGRQTVDDAERLPLYHEAQRLINENAYLIPVYIPETFTVLNSRVKDYGFDAVGALLLHDAWLE